MRVHLAILEASFGEMVAPGNALTEVALGGALAGPAETVVIFLRRGAELSKTSRSWEVTRKKP